MMWLAWLRLERDVIAACWVMGITYRLHYEAR